MVAAAAALLAEGPEQRRQVVSQRAAALLDEQTNQLAHLRGETAHGYEAAAILGCPSPPPPLLRAENNSFEVFYIWIKS